jgi:hypothetical protein
MCLLRRILQSLIEFTNTKWKTQRFGSAIRTKMPYNQHLQPGRKGANLTGGETSLCLSEQIVCWSQRLSNNMDPQLCGTEAETKNRLVGIEQI